MRDERARKIPISVLFAGVTGRVGRALNGLIGEWERREGARSPFTLRIVGIVNSRRTAWSREGLAPERVLDALTAGEPTDWTSIVERVRSRRNPVDVLLDCTASEVVARTYDVLLDAGVSVVTPNKKANAASYARYRRLQEAARERPTPYRYETTVGAALPILSTLAELKRSGDELREVSAALSGTLAYVFARLNEGAPFSAAVGEAWELGLTEPHPREDLSGEDVARKLLILLREAGVPIEREEILHVPLVPHNLMREDDPPRFIRSLRALDDDWAERIAGATARDRRLVYRAAFDGATARIGPMEVPQDDPLARLRRGENAVVLRTRRYDAVPLTIAGPGAGPEVTAAGVLNDLLAAARERALRRLGEAHAATRVVATSGPRASDRWSLAHPLQRRRSASMTTRARG